MVNQVNIEGDLTWEAIEALSLTHYISLGYSVLIPIIKTRSYDLAIEKNGNVKLVNVKVAGLKDKRQKDSWSISRSSSTSNSIYKRKNIKESYAAIASRSLKDLINKKLVIDIFLVWIPYKKKFIEINGDFFVGSGSKSKRIPKEILDKLNK
ncbi:group I intron-associated PD-(D/E)XK endonuclease [Pelagibacteraceae bacterium]|nr:group I intron-associated PD-(D/E)XK endonuclease [Pelagibacteraceae bacterium]